MLSTKQLTCIKQDRILFCDLSLNFDSGTLYYVRGPNGVGKTSLLKILIGLSAPSEGEVLWQSQSLADCREKVAKDLLYVGHKLGLSSSLSALENLHFWCQLQAISWSTAALMDKLALMGLAGLEDIPVRYLSAGQQRRVALTRLSCKPARCWILDEPFTSLDAEGIALVERQLAEFVATGGCAIVTSHQPLSPMAGPCTDLLLEYHHD